MLTNNQQVVQISFNEESGLATPFGIKDGLFFKALKILDKKRKALEMDQVNISLLQKQKKELAAISR